MVPVTDAAKIKLGDTVFVQGLGLLGIYGCAIAKARGARRVMDLDPLEHRLTTGQKFGADETISVSKISKTDLVLAVPNLC